MDLPVIINATPLVVPPVTTPQTTYNQLWLASVVIQAFDINADATGFVELVPYVQNTDGTKTAAPSPSITFKIPNLMALAQTDTDLATVMGLLMNYVIKAGREQGVVAAA